MDRQGRARGPGPLRRGHARLSRRIYASRAGEWIRDRLEAGRELTRVEIRLRRGHSDLDGLTVAFLSDLHAGHYLDARDLARLIERVAAAGPDLVCLGGDLADSLPEEIAWVARAVRDLDPPLGVLAVPGNHDHQADPGLERWRAILEPAGAMPLCNRGLRLKQGRASIWIGGIEDLLRGLPDLDAALDGRDPGEPALLLSHQPDILPHAQARDVDLVLSGHTHGGQIRLFDQPPPLRETRLGLWRGHFERGDTRLYVGRGVGVTGIPLRWNAPAEVPLVTLRV